LKLLAAEARKNDADYAEAQAKNVELAQVATAASSRASAIATNAAGTMDSIDQAEEFVNEAAAGSVAETIDEAEDDIAEIEAMSAVADAVAAEDTFVDLDAPEEQGPFDTFEDPAEEAQDMLADTDDIDNQYSDDELDAAYGDDDPDAGLDTDEGAPDTFDAYENEGF
jgi:hypothetical protein